VGFVYNHIGLGGVLLIDFSTYVVSFLCYFAVRKGRHVVPRPAELRADIVAAETAFQRFMREMREGFHFLRGHPSVILLGTSWALFLGAMLTAVVVTAPLSDLVFHAGAVGYGWLNAGWGTGAFVSVLYTPALIAALGARRSIAISMGLLTISAILARESLKAHRRLPVITTLHGTDITLVGADRSYLPITRYALEQSDGVTAISNMSINALMGGVPSFERELVDGMNATLSRIRAAAEG